MVGSIGSIGSLSSNLMSVASVTPSAQILSAQSTTSSLHPHHVDKIEMSLFMFIELLAQLFDNKHTHHHVSANYSTTQSPATSTISMVA